MIIKKIYDKLFLEESSFLYPIKKVLFKKRTKFNKIEILELEFFGKSLILNGEIQFSECDLKIFHEFYLKICEKIRKKSRILIIGGGDLLLANELVKNKNVEKIEIVEIDKEVIEVCKKFFRNYNNKAMKSKKVKIFIDDGFKFIKNSKSKYDIIFLDLPDEVIKRETLKNLRNLKRILNKGGKIIIQACSLLKDDVIKREKLKKIARKYFKRFKEFCIFIPSFQSLWFFIVFYN